MEHRPSLQLSGGRVSFHTPVLQAGSGAHPHKGGFAGSAVPLRPRSAAPTHSPSVQLHGGWIGSGGAGGSLSASPPSSGGLAAFSAPLHASLPRSHAHAQRRSVSGSPTTFVNNSISAAAASIGAAVAAEAPRITAQLGHHPSASRSVLASQRNAAAAAFAAAATAANVAASSHPASPAYHHSSLSPAASFPTSSAPLSFAPQQPLRSPSPPPPASGQHDVLIAQIADQWNNYMHTVAQESSTQSSKAAGASAGSGGASSLSLLLSRLHANELLNLFEFTSARQHLTIWGPSFDCLYFHGPVAASAAAAVVGSIYRDHRDYASTLGNLQTLTLRNVDWQLLSLHLPLIRQKMARLRSITLSHNNLHSLWQLEALAIFAPIPAAAANNAHASAFGHMPPGHSWPPLQLESVHIQDNAVCAQPLYRKFILSILCPPPPAPVAAAAASLPAGSPRSARSSPSSTFTRLSSASTSLVQLDGIPVSDAEVREAHAAFGSLHQGRRVLLEEAAVASASPLNHAGSSVTSAWQELLYECSLSAVGGVGALGTAANPLHSVSWAHSFPAAWCMPLPPVRPVAAMPAARKQARKLADELLTAAQTSAAQQRSFDAAWEEAVHGPGGVVDTWLAEGDALDVSDSAAASSGAARKVDSALPSSAPPSSLSAAQHHHRVVQDKIRTMRLFLTTSNPTALLANNAAASHLRKKKAER